jgi:hypothetical protein
MTCAMRQERHRRGAWRRGIDARHAVMPPTARLCLSSRPVYGSRHAGHRPTDPAMRMCMRSVQTGMRMRERRGLNLRRRVRCLRDRCVRCLRPLRAMAAWRKRPRLSRARPCTDAVGIRELLEPLPIRELQVPETSS